MRVLGGGEKNLDKKLGQIRCLGDYHVPRVELWCTNHAYHRQPGAEQGATPEPSALCTPKFHSPLFPTEPTPLLHPIGPYPGTTLPQPCPIALTLGWLPVSSAYREEE